MFALEHEFKREKCGGLQMERFRKPGIQVVSLLILTLVLMGCDAKVTTQPPAAQETEKIKVVFIYMGTVGDTGWNYAQDQGRKYLEQQLPYVQTSFIEGVAEFDAEKVLTDLAEKGANVVFATSYGYTEPVINVAKKYPKVIFMHCSGFKTAPNVGTYFGRMYQARYLSGIVAGRVTKTGKIGYVAAYPTPEVVRGINAFTLGVRSVNPNATVKVAWTDTWLNPTAEKDAGNSLIEEDVDLITQHQDTPGPIQAAEEKRVYSIGFNSDMSKFAPEGYLTSSVWNWGPYFVALLETIKEGKWESSRYWGSMADQVVGLAPYGKAVPEDVKIIVAEKKQEIVSGRWDVFTGPIQDQKGQVRVQDGERMSDQEMLGFDWFVAGVDGTILKK